MRKQDDRCSSKEVSCLPYFRILFSESPICPYLKLQQLFAVIHLSPPCNTLSESETPQPPKWSSLYLMPTEFIIVVAAVLAAVGAAVFLLNRRKKRTKI